MYPPASSAAQLEAPARLAQPACAARIPWWAFVGAAFVWLAATAWLRPLALPDEGRYVGVAWEMLRSGDWAVPRLNGLPFFHKPPLFYWITAASMAILGPCETAARIASLIGAALAAFSVGAFVRSRLGEGAARRVLLVLVTTPLFYGGAQFANLDMLAAGCISAAVVLAAHAILLSEKGARWRGPLALAFAAAALGTLAKGLIGAVLPALTLLAWCSTTRRMRRLHLLGWAPGVALFITIAAPWFVLMQMRFPEFFHYFFVHQHLERFAMGGFNNAQPWWFYAPVLAVTTLPWFAWAGLATRRCGGMRVLEPVCPSVDDVRRLMLAWLVVVVLFFSLPESKLVGYVFPALPPLAVLLAGAAEQHLARSPRAGGLWRVWVGVAAALCLAVLLVVQAHPRDSITPLMPAVRERWSNDDRLVMIDGFAYDAQFYLRTQRPAWLIDHWRDPDIARHDDGRKAFYDAARFASPEARAHLVEPDRAAQTVCDASVTWVIGKPDSPTRYPWLARLERVGADDAHAVWRWNSATSTMSCP